MVSPFFLSVVLVVRDQAKLLPALLKEATTLLSSLVADYELIVVDNASEDESVRLLQGLTGEKGLPNIQVYALTQPVDSDTAAWVGMENALGDFVAVFDPREDDLSFLPKLLEEVTKGSEVVFAENQKKQNQGFCYNIGVRIFSFLYKWLNGIHLIKEAPYFRVLSKRVVNFILQHPQPAVTYRHLPAAGGFIRANLQYSATPKECYKKSFTEGFERGIRLLVSTTRTPMRLVSGLALFGAVINLFYSIYVVGIAFFKQNIAPGWVTLSLQQSGMFFLICLLLLVLGEYILHMASLSNEGPLYHVGQEFTSVRMTRQEKLNIESVQPQGSLVER